MHANGDISHFNNVLLTNNFNGFPLTYAGETRVGGFGGDKYLLKKIIFKFLN